MADEAKITQAKQAYQTLCNALDELNWNCKKIEDQLKIETGARGNDLPIEVAVAEVTDRCLVMLLSICLIRSPMYPTAVGHLAAASF